MINASKRHYYESMVESCSMESIEVFKKEIQTWRLCTLVPKRTKNTSWEIYQKVVWSIQSTIQPSK